MSEFAIPRYNYAAQFPGLADEVVPRIAALLERGDYIRGPEVGEFEARFADFLNVRSVVGVNSGTDALILALEALGVGPGDEVIMVANTWHSTALAAVRVGARPVLVDCTDSGHLLDLDQVESAVTPATKALIAVHLFGRTADMDRARQLCRAHGLHLVEDCAQAVGARWAGERVGGLGDAGCWSFAPAKNLAAAGDAGAVSTNDAELAERIRLLGHFGQPAQNEHLLLGHNSRLDTLQAILLLHKLPLVDAWNAERVRVADAYRTGLAGLPIRFQDAGKPGEHVQHLFQIRVAAGVRDPLLAALRERGVDAVVRYPVPLHLQPAFGYLGYGEGAFPVAEALARETLCLPIRPDLAPADADYVCRTIREHLIDAGATH